MSSLPVDAIEKCIHHCLCCHAVKNANDAKIELKALQQSLTLNKEKIDKAIEIFERIYEPLTKYEEHRKAINLLRESLK